jgi:hypothetical protein
VGSGRDALPEPVQLPAIDLPEGGDVVLPLAKQQVLTRALLTAICSVGQPQPWVGVAARQLAQVPGQQLHRFLATRYDVLRMVLARLPDEGMLGTAHEVLNDLLGLDSS